MASGRPQCLGPPRPNSNPFVASPLQTTFPALDNSSSSPESPTPEGVAIRSSRPTESKTRMRAESRSSSVPVSLQVPRTWARATSPQAQDGSKSSVKHLTCFWWKEKGACRFSDEECLYAHFNTGRYSDAPRQVVPGEPAKAGRNLDRSLKNLSLMARNSSSSLNSITAPRPMTPGLEFPNTSHSNHSSFDFTAGANSQALSENAFLRGLISQSNHEKAFMISTVESLQQEKATLRTTINAQATENDQLVKERDALRAALSLQQQQQQRSLSHPYGAIGGHLSRSGRSTPTWTSAVEQNAPHAFRSFTVGHASPTGSNPYEDEDGKESRGTGGSGVVSKFGPPY